MWDNNTSNVFISYLMEGTSRPITGLDFASLYPNSIREKNISHETFICTQQDINENP